jgi:hypothetical protein
VKREKEVDRIRQLVRAGVKDIDEGNFVECKGRAGLKQLAADVKARGRKRLAQSNYGK